MENSERRDRLARLAAALVIGLSLSLFIGRNALLSAYASSDPVKVARFWPGHPSVTMEMGLAEIGRISAGGGQIEPDLVNSLLDAYRKAPLAPEPFLVRGVQAQVGGNERLAGLSYLTARDRDPRALGARYFLAEHYLRVDDVDAGLSEISALVRLVPQSLPAVAPYLAAYVRRPNAAPKIREVIRHQPKLETELLGQLAADHRNLDLILNLWSGQGGDEARGWQSRLLNELVAAGRFREARAVWTRFTGITPSRDQLFDREFAVTDRPPFGWTLVSGSGGVAEAQAGGRLHTIYYGRDNLVLASQLLTLNPGQYRLSMKRIGPAKASQSLSWNVRCLPSTAEIASLPLSQAGNGGAIAASFVVPPTACGAQSLDLVARAPEFPEQSELTLSELKLEREARQ